MANLRDLRLRMKAIRQTLQVTRAMNLISTSKLRKGRRSLEDTLPFFTRIQEIMCDILYGAGNVQSLFLDKENTSAADESSEKSGRRSAIIVITSDKGLAGGYNANIIHEVNALSKKVSNPVLILIGSVGYRHFINSPYLTVENFSFMSKLPNMDNAHEIAEYIIAQYQWGIFDEVYVVYTHMYSAVKLLPAVKHILPLNEAAFQEENIKSSQRKKTELNFEYHPSEEDVFDALVPMYINGVIYGCLIEAYASEHSARMAAMDEASKNAEEMLSSMQLLYNRKRQESITQEMTEIVSGSSGLK